MLTADGIDIKKAKLLIDGTQYGYFSSLELTGEMPREVMTTIGGEVKHRSGTDKHGWTGKGHITVGNVKQLLALLKKVGSFVIEGETADDQGVTETITLPDCQVTSYGMSFSDASEFSWGGICSEPV